MPKIRVEDVAIIRKHKKKRREELEKSIDKRLAEIEKRLHLIEEKLDKLQSIVQLKQK